MIKNISDIISEKSIKKVAQKLLWQLANDVEAVQGAIYLAGKNEEGVNVIRFIEGYAFHIAETKQLVFEFGDGIAGQVAKDAKTIYLDEIPEGYLTVLSGLGSSSPSYLLAMPIVDRQSNKLVGVIELASFKKIDATIQTETENALSEVAKRFLELLKHNDNE